MATYFRVSQQEVSQNPDYTSILTVRHCKINITGLLVSLLAPASGKGCHRDGEHRFCCALIRSALGTVHGMTMAGCCADV